mmetsp:Transcript_62215/g.111122  ORF Transcript_62215/g.111122 Transcript_62215/m.111122 type:complete len:417 (-) Transcript_62215:67-1317(-)
MGKGKAKGWRPPRSGEAASSLLFGSADHLTGDTIASPVQLREEGRAIPKGHPNYGEWDTQGSWRGGRGAGPGRGKGGGKAGEQGSRIHPSATGSNNMPVAPKAAASTKPTLQAEEAKAAVKTEAAEANVKAEEAEAAKNVAEETYEDGVFAEARHAANSLLASLGAAKEEIKKEVKKEVKEEVVVVEEVKKEVEDENEAKARRMSEAKTEIERRREAMLQREKAAQQSPGVTTCTSDDDAEARKRAVEARRREAEAKARQAEARRREALAANAARRREEEATRQEESQQTVSSSEPAKQEAEHVQAEEEQPVAEPSEGTAAVSVTEPPSAEAMPEPKRPRVEAASKAPGAAMQHGLQGWAARVNALAEDADADPELVKRCRDFVRKRILKAHATGDLHAIAWDEEPVPSLEELMLD